MVVNLCMHEIMRGLPSGTLQDKKQVIGYLVMWSDGKWHTAE